MKKKITCFVVLLTFMLLSSCSGIPMQTPANHEPDPSESPTETKGTSSVQHAIDTAADNGGGAIIVYSYTAEVQFIIDKFLESHPDFGFTVETNTFAAADALYEDALDEALTAGGADAPDIYCAEAAFVTKYTQGEMSGYAMPYDDLGIDVRARIEEADIARYTVDIGTRPSDGAVVGLCYQSTCGALIYRRSIAEEVWGTDEPAAIETKICCGWDKFFEAAEELKKKGCCIVSGAGDIWNAVESSSYKGWLMNGKLYIDPRREAYLDYSKALIDNGYTNDTTEWTEGWYNDMAGSGPRPVFGFFGPAWVVNYVIADKCGGTALGEGTYGDWAVCEPPYGFFWGGGWMLANKKLDNDSAKKAAAAELLEWITLDCTEEGLQYAWANGTPVFLRGTKDTVPSCTVMEMSDGTHAFLGGQDMFDVFIPASRNINANNITQYDERINSIWRDQSSMYATVDAPAKRR